MGELTQTKVELSDKPAGIEHLSGWSIASARLEFNQNLYTFVIVTA
jgi:hypothetical protein